MKNFTFSLKWHKILSEYPVEIRGEVYSAVIEYAATGIVIEMQPLARMAFDFIKYEIDERTRRREVRKAKKEQVQERMVTAEKKVKEERAEAEVETLADMWADNSPMSNEIKPGADYHGSSRHRRSGHSRNQRNVFASSGS